MVVAVGDGAGVEQEVVGADGGGCGEGDGEQLVSPLLKPFRRRFPL